MIDFIVWLNSNKGNSFFKRIKIHKLKVRLANFLERFILPYYLRIFGSRLNTCAKQSNREEIIVSLTSFPKRINTVWITVESLLRQTLKPDHIILWLSKEQFLDKETLPDKLLQQEKRGLQIKFVDKDLRSHKKYYYALKYFPSSYIITVDDDLLYHSTLVECLYQSSKKYDSIVCNWARLIPTKNELTIKYKNWKIVDYLEDNDSSSLFILSGGGTIFPPNSLYKDVLREDLFTVLTPLADDIWLNAMARLNKTRIVYLNSKYTFKGITIKQNEMLWTENINKNDIQIESVNKFYNRKLI